MTITVAVITYKRPEIVKRCVASIEAQDYLPDELIIVDCSPEPMELKDFNLDRLAEKTKYIYSEGRKNLPVMRNIALSHAATDIIVYIDDDAIAKPSWIKAILDGFNNNPSTLGVTGPTIDVAPDMNPLNSLVYDNKKRICVLPWGEVRSDAKRWIPNTPVMVDSMQGGNMSYRVNDIRAVGGFDEMLDFPSFREESDLQLSLSQNQPNRFLYHPDAFVYHMPNQAGGISDFEAARTDYFYRAGKNHKYFSDKHIPKLLSRLSWVLFSRNPPALIFVPLLTLIRKQKFIAWHKGLWGQVSKFVPLRKKVADFCSVASQACVVLSVATFSSLKLTLMGTPVTISSTFVGSALLFALLALFFGKKELFATRRAQTVIITASLAFLCIIIGTIVSLTSLNTNLTQYLAGEYVRVIANIVLVVLIALFSNVQFFLKICILAFFGQLIAAPLVYLHPDMFVSESRFVFTFDDPNYFAHYLVVPLVLMSYFVIRSQTWLQRIASFSLFVMLLSWISWSGSRGAWIGSVFAFIVFAFSILRIRGIKKFLSFIFMIICAVYIAFLALPNSIKPKVQDRLETVVVKKEAGEEKPFFSGQNRKSLWMQSLLFISNNPLGFGPGYQMAVSVTEANGQRQTAHNIILEILLVGGFGLLIWFGYVIFSISYPFVAALYNRKNLLYEYALFSAFIGILGTSLFLDSFNTRNLWIIGVILWLMGLRLKSSLKKE